MTDTPKLDRAMDILNQPLTIETIREFNQLADSAKGEEATFIGELFEALFVSASESPALFNEAQQAGLL